MSSTELTVISRELRLAIHCEKNYFYGCLSPSVLRFLESVFQVKASAPKSVQEIPESPLHSPTFQRGSQNVARSNHSSLKPDANGATSLALWLIQGPRYAFHYLRAETNSVCNDGAERKCNYFMLLYTEKSEESCITLTVV